MKKDDRFPASCFAIVLIAFILGAISPLSPTKWFLGSILIIISFTIFLLVHVLYRKFRFSNMSFALLTSFIVLHIIGSHYAYSETPIGFWIRDLFGFEGNHYDRIVNFLCGMLLYLPTFEISKHLLRIKKSSQTLFFYLIPAFILISFGAVYEVLEWSITYFLKEANISILGAQGGDIWDTQKDIALKSISSLLASIYVYFKQKPLFNN